MNVTEIITPTTVRRLAATLNIAPEPFHHGVPLPLGWHSIFGANISMTQSLSEDGTDGSGDLLPGHDLPRRMFGGARITFHKPLRVGDEITITSEIADVKHREGKSGKMAIVVSRLLFSVGGVVCVEEEQDVVQLPAAPPGAPPEASAAPPGKPAPLDPIYSATIQPTPVLLFRYSALTFNSHRVHYDVPYSKEREGLPALLVQGRLLSVLTMGLLNKHGLADRTKRFSYRSVRPIYADRPFHLGACLDDADGTMSMWAADAGNNLALSATVEFG